MCRANRALCAERGDDLPGRLAFSYLVGAPLVEAHTARRASFWDLPASQVPFIGSLLSLYWDPLLR
jgi:hypothetical protein